MATSLYNPNKCVINAKTYWHLSPITEEIEPASEEKQRKKEEKSALSKEPTRRSRAAGGCNRCSAGEKAN
jgi:hypothetical protein